MDTVQLEQLMVEQNPQWRQEDVWVKRLSLQRDIFDKIYGNLTKNRLVIAVNGPRRIGKSYLLKQLIAKLIHTGSALARNTLYISFSTSTNEKEIVRQIMDLFLAKYADRTRPAFVLLDEVQYLAFWPDQLKAIYDRELPIKFVVTGSTSLFYGQKTRESLLGRIEKLPMGVMNFKEYLRFKGLSHIVKNRADFLTHVSLFRTEFRPFLFGGQLPELVVNTNIEPAKYLRDMGDTLINFDVAYLYAKLDRTLFSNLVKSLSFSIASEFSVNKTAKELESDRPTISSYVQILGEIGLFTPCLNGYFRRMRAKLSAVKKIYSLNTNLSLAINGFDKSYLNDSRVLGAYAENYVYMRLAEMYDRKIEYYSDRKREADFLTEDMVWEVKYGVVGDIAKYEQIAQKLHRKLTIVTENEWDEENQIRKLPIYLL